MESIEAKIKSVLSEILDIDENEIHSEFGPDDADNWDSLQNLKLITALESEFDIKLAMKDIEQMVNFSEIKRVISDYLKS